MLSKEKIKTLAERVNECWQKKITFPGNCAWERSCYTLGNLAAYDITGNEEYIKYAVKWADANNRAFFVDTENGMDYGNDLLCGEIYFRLKDIGMGDVSESVLEIMQKSLDDIHNDYWWWIDAIYMALPFFQQMGIRYSDSRYFDKAYRVYSNARNERRLYDKDEHLWFRDENYLPENKLEANGRKIFWGRGNGWVFAGIARALDTMDSDNPYYSAYSKDLRDMAEALKNVQNEDGSYCVSFFDKETYPYHESSSTVLITLGYFAGLRLGVLDDKYFETAKKGFDWLTNTALKDSGFIGYAQDIAGWPSHKVDENLSKDYVVGTYLLILKELYNL